MVDRRGNPLAKVADAELHFQAGPLWGMNVIGFAVWERRCGAGRDVTFPARPYSVNGERHLFALLRPAADAAAMDRVRDLVHYACGAEEEHVAADATGSLLRRGVF